MTGNGTTINYYQVVDGSALPQTVTTTTATSGSPQPITFTNYNLGVVGGKRGHRLVNVPTDFRADMLPFPRLPAGRSQNRILENAAGEAEVWIYDAIDPFGVNAEDFARDLAALKAKKILVHMNTPGGIIWDGISIYNALASHPAEVTIRIEGIAASAGSFIAMAGDRIVMAPHAQMMIHEGQGFTMGPAADHRKTAEILDMLSNEIASIYAERAGGTEKEWRARMIEELWLRDQEAIDLGLADEIDERLPPAKNTHDLSRYRNVPETLTEQAVDEAHPDRTPTKREIEDALRDVGLSSSKAKAFVSEGWKALTARDESDEADGEEETEAPGENTTAAGTGTVDDAEYRQRIRDLIQMRERDWALTK
jgi:ATP-dependent protease ClpP protease subunit